MGLLRKKEEVAPTKYEPEIVAPKEAACKAPIDGKPCGKPLATGQTEVCTMHVRAG